MEKLVESIEKSINIITQDNINKANQLSELQSQITKLKEFLPSYVVVIEDDKPKKSKKNNNTDFIIGNKRERLTNTATDKKKAKKFEDVLKNTKKFTNNFDKDGCPNISLSEYNDDTDGKAEFGGLKNAEYIIPHDYQMQNQDHPMNLRSQRKKILKNKSTNEAVDESKNKSTKEVDESNKSVFEDLDNYEKHITQTTNTEKNNSRSKTETNDNIADISETLETIPAQLQIEQNLINLDNELPQLILCDGDGNCALYAILLTCDIDLKYHKELRLSICNAMKTPDNETEKDVLKALLDQDPNYITNMEKDKEYLTHFELGMLSNRTNIPITIIRKDRKEFKDRIMYLGNNTLGTSNLSLYYDELSDNTSNAKNAGHYDGCVMKTNVFL